MIRKFQNGGETFASWRAKNGYGKYNSAAGRKQLAQELGIWKEDVSSLSNNMALWKALKERSATPSKPVSELPKLGDAAISQTQMQKKIVNKANDAVIRNTTPKKSDVEKQIKLENDELNSSQTRKNYLRLTGANSTAGADLSKFTPTAIKEFQKENGLAVDGIVGPQAKKAYDLKHGLTGETTQSSNNVADNFEAYFDPGSGNGLYNLGVAAKQNENKTSYKDAQKMLSDQGFIKYLKNEVLNRPVGGLSTEVSMLLRSLGNSIFGANTTIDPETYQSLTMDVLTDLVHNYGNFELGQKYPITQAAYQKHNWRNQKNVHNKAWTIDFSTGNTANRSTAPSIHTLGAYTIAPTESGLEVQDIYNFNRNGTDYSAKIQNPTMYDRIRATAGQIFGDSGSKLDYQIPYDFIANLYNVYNNSKNNNI